MQHCEHVKQAEAEAAVVIALCFRWHAIMLTFAQSRRPHRAVGLPVESALFFLLYPWSVVIEVGAKVRSHYVILLCVFLCFYSCNCPTMTGM